MRSQVGAGPAFLNAIQLLKIFTQFSAAENAFHRIEAAKHE